MPSPHHRIPAQPDVVINWEFPLGWVDAPDALVFGPARYYGEGDGEVFIVGDEVARSHATIADWAQHGPEDHLDRTVTGRRIVDDLMVHPASYVNEMMREYEQRVNVIDWIQGLPEVGDQRARWLRRA